MIPPKRKPRERVPVKAPVVLQNGHGIMVNVAELLRIIGRGNKPKGVVSVLVPHGIKKAMERGLVVAKELM